MHRENFFTIYQWKASDGNQMHLSMYLILNLSKTGDSSERGEMAPRQCESSSLPQWNGKIWWCLSSFTTISDPGERLSIRRVTGKQIRFKFRQIQHTILDRMGFYCPLRLYFSLYWADWRVRKNVSMHYNSVVAVCNDGFSLKMVLKLSITSFEGKCFNYCVISVAIFSSAQH